MEALQNSYTSFFNAGETHASMNMSRNSGLRFEIPEKTLLIKQKQIALEDFTNEQSPDNDQLQPNPSTMAEFSEIMAAYREAK